MEPYEIIMAPYTIYTAPLDETFPDVDETPGGNWSLLGTSGNKSYEDEGVSVSHEQTIVEKRTAGCTGPIKAVRTEEGLKIHVVLADVTVETYAKVLNGLTLTDTAAASGEPGFRVINLRQGPTVAAFSLLVRGASPYGEDWNAQYEIPKVYQSASPKPVYGKGQTAQLEVEFTALEDPDAATDAERFGYFRAQDADALA
jgi:hypothetical protein